MSPTCKLALTSLWFRMHSCQVALIQAPTFLRHHTKTHSDNNRRHWERDCHGSITTQLWIADMPMLSNNTEVSVHYCHSKHMVASSRTLSDLI
jgi:hypothetical protein